MKKILLLILILPVIAACERRVPRVPEPESKVIQESVEENGTERMSDEKIDILDDDSDGDSIDDGEESSERRRVEVLKSNKQGDPDANKYDFGNDTADNNCGEGTISDDGTCVAKSAENNVDDDCDSASGEACESLDDDSDGDSIPATGTNNSNITN